MLEFQTSGIADQIRDLHEIERSEFFTLPSLANIESGRFFVFPLPHPPKREPVGRYFWAMRYRRTYELCPSSKNTIPLTPVLVQSFRIRWSSPNKQAEIPSYPISLEPSVAYALMMDRSGSHVSDLSATS